MRNSKPWINISSIRTKLIALVFILTLPLIAMLIYNNAYAIKVVRNQVAESYINLLNLYIVQVDSDLENTEQMINDILASDPNFLAMEQASSEEVYTFNKIQVSNQLNLNTRKVQSIESFFVYDTSRNDYLDVYKQRKPIESRESMKEQMILMLMDNITKEHIIQHRWVIHEINGEYYLLYVVRSGNLYFGARINANELNNPLKDIDLGSNGGSLFATNQGEVMTNSELANISHLDLRYNPNGQYRTGENEDFLAVNAPSVEAEFSLVAIIPDEKILENLPYLQRIIIWIMIASFIILPLGLYYLRKTILVPLFKIVSSMKKIQGDNLNVRIEYYPTSLEFQIVNDTFNRMISEIEGLRISVYEEQLAKQREELQRLQLQMNPHFFMNSLNMLYSLARANNVNIIQELSLCLIHYYRFMVRSHSPFVQLKDELEHTRNYLRIQELRYPDNLSYTVSVPDFLLESRIPPLFIQTFVENSIKHGVTLDEKFHISVQIDFIEYESVSCIKIQVKDTGPGFPEDILQVINSGESVVNSSGEHLGVWNVQRRLRLLYKDHTLIKFMNISPSGAEVELIMPLNAEE